MRDNPIELAKTTFKEDGLNFFEEEGGMSLLFGISAHNGRYMCHALVKESPVDDLGDIIIIVSDGTEYVPRKKRGMALELINKVNSGISVGNFQMDADGSISFRTGAQIPRDDLSPGIVRHLLISNIMIMDSLLPGIMDNIRGDGDQGDDVGEGIFGDFGDKMALV